MADLSHLTLNRLERLADARLQLARRRVLLVGLPLIAVTLIVSRSWAVVVALAVAYIYLTRSRDPVTIAGAQGEGAALAWLKTLPDAFVIFNNVHIASPESRTGFKEADLIVCGPNAIFVLEVKHNSGTITCDESFPAWSVLKVGRGGTPYGKTMRNPVWQVKGFVTLLVDHLKAHDARVWVQPLVVFTHQDAELYIPFEPSVPILRPYEAVEFILDYPGRSGPAVQGRATQVILDLARQPPPGAL